MAFDYATFATEIDALIDNMGKSVTLTIKPETPTDAAKPWRGTTGTPTTAAVNAVEYDFELEAVDGTLVKRGDVQFIVAAKDLSAYNSKSVDTITDGSTVWGVQGVAPINPGGTNIAFVFHARK